MLTIVEQEAFQRPCHPQKPHVRSVVKQEDHGETLRELERPKLLGSSVNRMDETETTCGPWGGSLCISVLCFVFLSDVCIYVVLMSARLFSLSIVLTDTMFSTLFKMFNILCACGHV